MKKTPQGQEASQKARALRATLLRDHGVDVPHSALRAALLKTQGLEPHAQRETQASSALRPETWAAFVAQWMGDYDVVLKTKAYNLLLNAPFQPKLLSAPAANAAQTWLLKELYLVPDKDGGQANLAFDVEGILVIPKDSLEDQSAELVQLKKTGRDSLHQEGAAEVVAVLCLSPQPGIPCCWRASPKGLLPWRGCSNGVGCITGGTFGSARRPKSLSG